ncbi:MAG: hypothetical protein IT384_16000 [Deltaproteobacteria bacterium]|nr:hypothetical protein [Deltaproteobacteria bacterium]
MNVSIHRLSVLLATSLVTPPAIAGELTGSVGAQLFSSYYFRGADIFDGRPNVQPSASLGWTDPAITLGVWAAVPLARRSQLKNVRDEIDVTLNWDLPILDLATISAGGILYLNPAAEPFFNTEEVYLLARAPLGAGFAARAGVYADLDALRGVYATFGPGYVLETLAPLKVEAWLMAGLSKYRGHPTSLLELGATVSVTYEAGHGVLPTVSSIASWNAFAQEMRYAMSAGGSVTW